MRVGKVPSNISVSSRLSDGHCIVTAVKNSTSYQRFILEALQCQQSLRAVGKSPFFAPRLRFSIDNLLPEDMGSLLVLCRAITHPTGSFTFSFQDPPTTSLSGDLDSDTQPSDNVALTKGIFRNVVCMHVVERIRGDFVPNNLIYDRLKSYQIRAGHLCKINGFTEFLEETQNGRAQSAQEACQTLKLLHNNGVMLSSEIKFNQDPLRHNDEAQRKSIENLNISTNSPDTDVVFTFYPFRVSVRVSIPYRSKNFCVMVNLKPIVRHHLLVVPLRCVGTIHGLTDEEVEDWGRTMVLTLQVLNGVQNNDYQNHSLPDMYEDANYCVAIQQGSESGQTVPHLHTHVIPFNSSKELNVGPDDDTNELSRLPRTEQEMAEETAFLKGLFDKFANSIS